MAHRWVITGYLVEVEAEKCYPNVSLTFINPINKTGKLFYKVFFYQSLLFD